MYKKITGKSLKILERLLLRGVEIKINLLEENGVTAIGGYRAVEIGLTWLWGPVCTNGTFKFF